MAKSIYEILADLTTTTSVPNHGSEIEHTIPENLFPDDSTFESAELLLEWAEDHGFTHALLQKGIQKGLIDARATFKSCKKDDTWTPEYGQANVDKMEWTITKRPNQGNKKVSEAVMESGLKVAQAMKLAGVTDDIIKVSLTASFKPEEVEAIISALND